MQSFIALCLLVFVGHWLRTHVRVFRMLFLPSCVIAGLLGLLILQVTKAAGTPIPDVWTAGWGKLPGLLVNVVFACLFLGVVLPRFSKIVRNAGPQLGYGQIVAWGQYVVGIGLFLLVIRNVWPDLPDMFAAIMPVGFEGGHGTATGMATEFSKHGWEAGGAFGLTSATTGMIAGVIVGMGLINWAARRGHTVRKQSAEQAGGAEVVIPEDRRPSAGKLPVSPDVIGSLTLHVVIIGIACGVGWLIKQGLVFGGEGLDGLINQGRAVEEKQVTTFSDLGNGFPLFPLCMLGGLVVQLFDQRVGKHRVIDHGLTRRVQNLALDFLVVAAIANIRIEAMAGGLAPFAILVVAGIIWNVFCVLVLARWLLPNAWFERSIAEMGQSMGVTATGLLLLRVVDPEYDSPAADAFASKQLLHEPFMGGGIWTTLAVLWLANPAVSIWRVFWIATAFLVAWLVVLIIARARRKA
jgi:glutamate:Na+ symporter, ESS family